jgi:shikimate 5-dehydrogenase
MIHLNKKQFKDFFDGIRAEKIRKEETTIPLKDAIKLRK